MSRRGNCYDNAVEESFFQLLKRERIKRKVYTTREQARADVFDYIEMFYNPKRRHGHAADMSPRAYEKQYFRSEEHTSELQSRGHLVCRLLLEKKKKQRQIHSNH